MNNQQPVQPQQSPGPYLLPGLVQAAYPLNTFNSGLVSLASHHGASVHQLASHQLAASQLAQAQQLGAQGKLAGLGGPAGAAGYPMVTMSQLQLPGAGQLSSPLMSQLQLAGAGGVAGGVYPIMSPSLAPYPGPVQSPTTPGNPSLLELQTKVHTKVHNHRERRPLLGPSPS